MLPLRRWRFGSILNDDPGIPGSWRWPGRRRWCPLAWPLKQSTWRQAVRQTEIWEEKSLNKDRCKSSITKLPSALRSCRRTSYPHPLVWPKDILPSPTDLVEGHPTLTHWSGRSTSYPHPLVWPKDILPSPTGLAEGHPTLSHLSGRRTPYPHPLVWPKDTLHPPPSDLAKGHPTTTYRSGRSSPPLGPSPGSWGSWWAPAWAPSPASRAQLTPDHTQAARAIELSHSESKYRQTIISLHVRDYISTNQVSKERKTMGPWWRRRSRWWWGLWPASRWTRRWWPSPRGARQTSKTNRENLTNP